MLAAFEPALALARAAELSLDDVVELVSIAYFEQFRRRGLSFENIARRLDKSARSISVLSKKARTLIRQEPDVGTLEQTRAMLEILSSEQLPHAELVARFPPTVKSKVRATIRQLLADGVLEVRDRHIRVAAKHLSLVHSDLDKRLHGARRLLGSLSSLLYWRFFRENTDDSKAFGRVIDFRLLPERFQMVQERVFALIEELAVELDEEANNSPGQGTSATIAFSIAETPPHPAWRTPKRFR